MLELGHTLALNSLPQAANRGSATVILVIANADLVEHYAQLFERKQAEADPRVIINWISMATFKEKLKKDPELYAKAILVVDEGDIMLEKEIRKQLSVSYPKTLVMLSAVEREQWSGL